ncbi:MAG TPA: zinc ribbon domain-containing protein [Jatrophihabitans sp.]|jgi:predicted amidophosphoribosyltransferase
MDCPHCGTPHAAAARFCARCGTPLHPHTNRSNHYAANPDEPVRALALLSTLLPHMSGRRHHLYRNVVLLALLIAFVAAGFGVLSIALIVPALALPAIVLVYLHDHHIWRSEPAVVIGGGFALALVLGVLVGLLQRHWSDVVILGTQVEKLPPGKEILELGIVIPVLLFVAVVIGPLAVTSRPNFRHPLDAVNMSSLAGAAASLGFSVVVQHGAFTDVNWDNTDPGRAAFIALTLGFVQPIVFAAGAALTTMRVRRPNSNRALGIAEGLALIVLYCLASTLLNPYGTRGVVLTAVIAAFLAAIGVLLMRIELHDGLLAEARNALEADSVVERSAAHGQICGHCGVELGAGAAFCQVCGTAVSSLATPAAAAGSPSAPASGGALSPSAG